MDQWQQWMDNIKRASGADSSNIYQNYVNTGAINAAPEASTAARANIQATIDSNQQAEAAKIKQLDIQRQADAEDPSKAYMKLGSDGKYRFYKGDGTQININSFSLLTGKRPDEILADSENPADQKFLADYQTMKDFVNAWVNGDNDTLKRLRASDPTKYEQLISTYKTPSDMVAAFRNYYSDYYGNTQDANNQGTARFTSSNLNPKLDLTTSSSDSAQKQDAINGIAGSTLSQTLKTTPSVVKDPGLLNNIGYGISQYGPAALFGGGTLWGKSSDQTAYEAYLEKIKNDPWAAYNSYLSSGN